MSFVVGHRCHVSFGILQRLMPPLTVFAGFALLAVILPLQPLLLYLLERWNWDTSVSSSILETAVLIVVVWLRSWHFVDHQLRFEHTGRSQVASSS